MRENPENSINDIDRYALFIHKKAALCGNELAFAYIGWFYENGYGVKTDYKKALEWYKKGINALEPQAMRNYGGLFDEGLGVAKNEEEALYWYLLAAKVENSAEFREGLESVAPQIELTTVKVDLEEFQCCFGEKHFENHLRRL